jgi:hypothetical protein
MLSIGNAIPSTSNASRRASSATRGARTVQAEAGDRAVHAACVHGERGDALVVTKPGEHPEFFRFPAPEGRSRESTIRLDGAGTFTHDGAVVEHPRLALAMHTWIRRHPDDGRYILSNGYDWTYFTVEDAPFTVRSVRQDGDHLVLGLSDATEEAWVPKETRVGADGALYARVKRGLGGAPFEAKFTRHAQAALAPYLVETGGHASVRVGAAESPIGGG